MDESAQVWGTDRIDPAPLVHRGELPVGVYAYIRRYGLIGMAAVALALLAACSAGKNAGNASKTSGTAKTAAGTAAAGTAHYATMLAASIKVATGTKAALCGFPLKACAHSAIGHVAARQPKAQTVGSFSEVDLTPYFQSDAIIPPQKVSTAKAGVPPYKGVGKYKLAGAGNGLSVGSIPVPYAPNTGTWKVPITWHGHTLQVPFLMPAGGVGVKNAFDWDKQLTITVPAGKYLGFWLLETGINGGGGPTNVGAVYKGGTVRKYGVYYQPNCNTATSLPQFLVYAAPYFLTATGVNTGCHVLFAEAVPINPSHTLTKLVFPANKINVNNKMVIMALTLQKPAAKKG